MRKIPSMSTVSQIYHQLNHWVAHTVQKPQTKSQQSVELMSKIPPLFDGPTSWFKYEELIDDWLTLTQHEAGKCGPTLKNRLVGDASIYKKLLDRESLRSEDGVKYFKNTLRPHFTRGGQSVFIQRCC